LVINLKLIQPLDHSKISSLKNLMPKFSGLPFAPGNKYSVAYQWGTVGLMYRKDKIKNMKPSLDVLFDPKSDGGPFLLLDSVREQIGIALKYLG